MGGFAINGLIGPFVFLATIAVLILTFVSALIVYLFKKGSADSWSGNVLLTAAFGLILDGVFYLLIIFPKESLKPDEAKAMDQFMLYIWLPVHLIGFVLIVLALRYFRSRKKI